MEGADFALVQHRESVREIFDATQIAQRQSESGEQRVGRGSPSRTIRSHPAVRSPLRQSRNHGVRG